MWRASVALAVALLATACGEAPVVSDGPPLQEIDVSGIPDAVPMIEPITIAGNRSPYQVLGKTYRVLPTSKGYEQTGYASWYGRKFHGRLTSNGEIYNMYGMTAAHKTLPIPSYVRVTNQATGSSVVVRINDRGPFHSDRIIDLSYAAAKKLGFYESGTAPVHLVAIDPATTASKGAASAVAAFSTEAGLSANLLPGNTYLQTGAFAALESAEQLKSRILGHTAYPVVIRQAQATKSTLYKVLVGPIVSSHELVYLRSLLQNKENLSSFVVYL